MEYFIDPEDEDYLEDSGLEVEDIWEQEEWEKEIREYDPESHWDPIEDAAREYI
ncbi:MULTISPECIES: hypothetical protein [unclassified Sporosarcina]|uniref:hypothetical protein n=1 Tax=unclassified Sporosarcina TaxID=2647733 RepID=UPI00204066DA|nr:MULTISPECIES: hypothetical protein [unclassified Sporosarcina]GKV66220.1 hypothetical protein NCCP2331_23730 [Sporosarcina sp. NCCP-2331]GLB56256.1 hypothetical protein NCCP2378_20430 [Sporosarcina sp. NCCP-2378]